MVGSGRLAPTSASLLLSRNRIEKLTCSGGSVKDRHAGRRDRFKQLVLMILHGNTTRSAREVWHSNVGKGDTAVSFAHPDGTQPITQLLSVAQIPLKSSGSTDALLSAYSSDGDLRWAKPVRHFVCGFLN